MHMPKLETPEILNPISGMFNSLLNHYKQI